MMFIDEIGGECIMNCKECNSKLGFLGGFKHPIKGRKHIVCNSCFEVANAEVMKNREEVLMEVGQVYDEQPNYFPVVAKATLVSLFMRK